MNKVVLPADAQTPKGFLRKAAVDDLKEQVLSRISVPLTATENGTYVYDNVETADGRPVYVTLHLVVGFADPYVKPERKVKEKEVVALEIPSIFE